jgi:hypothetical protein
VMRSPSRTRSTRLSETAAGMEGKPNPETIR